MNSETRILQEIYSRFIRGELSVDDAARQVAEHARLHKTPIGSLDLEPMSNDSRSRVCELLDYLLQPIVKQFFDGKILSPNSSYCITAPDLEPYIWS